MAARKADKDEVRRWLVKADGAWHSLPGDAHACASWERLEHTRGHAALLIHIIVVCLIVVVVVVVVVEVLVVAIMVLLILLIGV